MSLSVLGGVLRLVDVGADDAVQIAPTYHEAHCYATLVDAFSVIGHPDDGIGDAWIDA